MYIDKNTNTSLTINKCLDEKRINLLYLFFGKWASIWNAIMIMGRERGLKTNDHFDLQRLGKSKFFNENF